MALNAKAKANNRIKHSSVFTSRYLLYSIFLGIDTHCIVVKLLYWHLTNYCAAAKAKKSRSLFSHYKSGAPSQRRMPAEDSSSLTTSANSRTQNSRKTVCAKFPQLKPLYEYVFCVPASSAPVERDFSQSGLIMRPNRAPAWQTWC